MNALEKIGQFAARLRESRGWARVVWALVLGAVGALAQPPLGAAPVLALAAPGFLWLLEGTTSRRQAFALGWWFGFGYFVLGLYWISFALLVDIAQFWWVMPLAIAGLPAGLALFWGGASVVLQALGKYAPGNRPLAFTLVWGTVEWLRGHVLTGFPWLLAGYAWTDWLPVAQSAAVVGVYGLTFFTWGVAALPVLLDGRTCPPRQAVRSVMAGVTLLGVMAAAGAWHLSANPLQLRDGPPEGQIRLVQPNIDQWRKWAPAERDRNLMLHMNLTHRLNATGNRPQVAIWPETALSFFVTLNPSRRDAVASAVPPGGVILTGAPRTTQDAEGKREFWNSLIALDGSGAVTASYDKFHLVPFGEFIPLRSVLSTLFAIKTIAGAGSDFSPGPGPRTVHLPGLPPFSPLVCYEVIFPHAVTDPLDRPDWLLNVTNDAWYGRSAGPHQHLAIARMRAVEEGLPLIRVANTGISAVVDAHGRLVSRIPLGEEGVIDTNLPIAAGPTPYARFGDIPLAVLMLAGLALLYRSRRML